VETRTAGAGGGSGNPPMETSTGRPEPTSPDPTHDRSVSASSKNYRYSVNMQVVIDANTRLGVAAVPSCREKVGQVVDRPARLVRQQFGRDPQSEWQVSAQCRERGCRVRVAVDSRIGRMCRAQRLLQNSDGLGRGQHVDLDSPSAADRDGVAAGYQHPVRGAAGSEGGGPGPGWPRCRPRPARVVPRWRGRRVRIGRGFLVRPARAGCVPRQLRAPVAALPGRAMRRCGGSGRSHAGRCTGRPR
jgi:hypothetical protein